MTLIGAALFIVAIGIIYSGAVKISIWMNGEELKAPGMLALWAALISIILKEGVYHYSMVKARQLNSQAVEANAWHHRSDALSSIGTLIGIGGAILLGDKWTILDPLASAVVGLFIIRTAWKLLSQSFGELMEASLPKEVEKEILDIVTSFPDVEDPHNLKTRRIGNRYAIEMHIRMDGSTSLLDAHSRTHYIEKALKEKFGEETHVVVHVEPTKPFEKH
jgi:cation diffusion facilitator family transporter